MLKFARSLRLRLEVTDRSADLVFRHNTKFSVLSPGYSEHSRLSKAQLRSSDMIICATPSELPLFDETILTNPNGRIKGRLIIAVGSFRPEMIELPSAILYAIMTPPHL